MTNRYLVLPRGINVGRHNRVPMAELRSRLVGEGYSEVATVLASGNVILTARSGDPGEVARGVGRLLSDHFNVSVPCLARTADQVRGVLALNPLREVATDPSRYLVNFLSEEPDPGIVEALMEEDHGRQAVVVAGAEAYVWTPDGVKALTLSHSYLQKRLGVVATARNWNTLLKIIAKL